MRQKIANKKKNTGAFAKSTEPQQNKTTQTIETIETIQTIQTNQTNETIQTKKVRRQVLPTHFFKRFAGLFTG